MVVATRLGRYTDGGWQIAIVEILRLRHVAEYERYVPVVVCFHPRVGELKAGARSRSSVH